MIKAEIVPATMDHIREVAANIRDHDRDEIYASCLLTPLRALEFSMRVSRHVWAGLVNGKTICVFGVSGKTTLSDVGMPWMIGTPLVEKYQRTFLRRCRRCVGVMLSEYTALENYVDVRNVASVKWLRWLGFEMDEPMPYGPFGLPFMRFEMRS